MEILQTIVNVGNDFVWGAPMIVLLVGSGIYVTCRMAFIQVRRFRHSLSVISGKYDNPEDEGDINHFQALSTALSATVGIGNIAGVATAIHYGGPGALFWMWVTAFFGMALKYTECTLSMKYRVFDEKGNASGGPMYYIERGIGRAWRPMAVMFAICAIASSFGSGNMNQANTVALSAQSDLGAPTWLAGATAALLVGCVIVGGIRRIGLVSSRLAPFMGILYAIGSLTILVLNIDQVPGVLATIFREAFSPRAGFGGTAAGAFMTTLLWGVKRGLFSNEAGQGSAPIAHAAAKTAEPVREGVVAMIGPFIDTIVICTMTGLVILLAGVWDQKRPDAVPLSKVGILAAPGGIESDRDLAALRPFSGTFAVEEGRADGVVFVHHDGSIEEYCLKADGDAFTGKVTIQETGIRAEGAEVSSLTIKGKILQNSSPLTAWAFQKGLAPIMPHGNLIVTFSVFLFALSTMISWSYYGDRCVEYLFGVRYVIVYRIFYTGFVFLGATLSLETVWAYGDLALGLMAIPNLIAVLFLAGKVRAQTDEYFSRPQEPLRRRG